MKRTEQCNKQHQKHMTCKPNKLTKPHALNRERKTPNQINSGGYKFCPDMNFNFAEMFEGNLISTWLWMMNPTTSEWLFRFSAHLLFGALFAFTPRDFEAFSAFRFSTADSCTSPKNRHVWIDFYCIERATDVAYLRRTFSGTGNFRVGVADVIDEWKQP